MPKIKNTNILIILQTAKRLGIKTKVLDWEKYKIRLTKGEKTHQIWKKSMGINSHQGISISRDKHKTYQALKKAGLPVLKQLKISSSQDYLKKANQIPFPQVIKPLYGEKGQDIYLNIKNKKQGAEAIKQYFQKVQGFAKQKSYSCVVEPYFHPAQDYRFIVLGGQVIGFSQRKPPVIFADGQHNIKELIKIENQKRADYNQKIGRRMLNRMLIWKRVEWYLNQQGLKFTDILPKNKKITLYPIPNFSTGGSVTTIPLNKIHPSFITLAQKTTQAIGLTLIGIDVMIKDLDRPVSKKNCAIIEVNSDPGLRLHDWPNQGEPQNVTEKILKYIFSSHLPGVHPCTPRKFK